MDIANHADILYAYIARLSVADLESIIEAERATWHAAVNGGTSEQSAAQKASRDNVRALIKRMHESDRDTIATIVRRNATK